jgi:hypothetical protein
MYSYTKVAGVFSLAGLLILFSQFSAGIAITGGTLIGVVLLLVICYVAFILQKIFYKIKFPLLAWVSTLALIICLPQSPFYALLQKYLNQVDFLAITVPVLAFAGFAVADRLIELKNISYKIIIVAIFVFGGRILLSAMFAQLVLNWVK